MSSCFKTQVLLFTTGDNLQESSRIVIPAKRPYIGMDNDPNVVTGPPPPRMAYVNQHHSMFGVPPQQPLIPPQLQPPQRRGFDYSRLGSMIFF